MAEIIDFAEIQAARLQQRQRREHESLERAVELMRMNLVAVAIQLENASMAERLELLDRLDKLSAVMRYGIRLLGNAPAAPFDDVGRAG
jgi:hypothetical protein